MSDFTVPATAQPTPANPGERLGPRVAVHLVWEAMLLVLLLAVVGLLAAQAGAHAFTGWLGITATGLLASGVAVSLRTGTPNLAVGVLSAAAGAGYAKLAVEGVPGIAAAGLAVLAVVLFGLVLGLFAGLTKLPAWAVSAAAIPLGLAVVFALTRFSVVTVPAGARLPLGDGLIPLLAFLVISIGGAACWLFTPLRTAFGGDRRRLPAALLGFGGSSLLAGAGGIMVVAYLGAASAGSGYADVFTPFGIALLGGASLFGRHAGLAGTALAALLYAILQRLLNVNGVTANEMAFVGAAVVLVGLLASWLLGLVGDAVSRSRDVPPAHVAQPDPAWTPATR